MVRDCCVTGLAMVQDDFMNAIPPPSAPTSVAAIPRRLVAFTLDLILLAVAAQALLLVAFPLFVPLGDQGYWLGYVLFAAYFGLLDAAPHGGSPGKRAFELRVVRGGAPIGPGLAALRALVLMLPLLLPACLAVLSTGLPLGATSTHLFAMVFMAAPVVLLVMALVLPLADRVAGRALHDRVAGTLVVRTADQGAAPPPPWRGQVVMALVIGVGAGAAVFWTFWPGIPEAEAEGPGARLVEQRLKELTERLDAKPEVVGHSVSAMGTSIGRTGEAPRDVSWGVTLSVALRHRPADFEEVARRYAALAQPYVKAHGDVDSLSIAMRHGATIGLAWRWEEAWFEREPDAWGASPEP